MSVLIETVRCDDFSMRYFRFGRGGRSMVILPGLSLQSVIGSADAVARAYGRMAEDFTVTVFDRREELPPVYSVSQMADDTARAMEALGMRDLCLFGASQGGMMAILIAARHPELVGRLALGSTAARVDSDRAAALSEWVRLAENGDAEGLCLAFGEAVYPPPVFAAFREVLLEGAKTVTAEDLGRFAVLARGTEGFDAEDEARSIRCPVLALTASDDRVLGPGTAEEFGTLFGDRPDFSLHDYRGYGHAAYDTAPDYKERLRRFFTA